MPFLLFLMGGPAGGSYDTRYAPERLTTVERMEDGRPDVLDAPEDRVEAREVATAVYQRNDSVGRGHVCGRYADGGPRCWTTVYYVLRALIDPGTGETLEVTPEASAAIAREFEQAQAQAFIDQAATRREGKRPKRATPARVEQQAGQAALF